MWKNRKNNQIEDTAENAMRTAISLLAYKENTKKELFSKLVERGYSRENAMEAVDFTVGKGYLSEERYLDRYIESCVKSLYGKNRILMTARKKGFEEDLFTNDLFTSVNFDEYCYVALLKCKKTNATKARNTLLRRGYSSAEITRSLKRYLTENGVPYGSEEKEEDLYIEAFSDDDI